MRWNSMRLWTAALAASLSIAAVAADDATDKELKKFQGTWVLVSGEMDGKKLKEEHVGRSEMTWKGNEITLTSPHQSEAPIRARITRISTDKTPKEMEWVRETGPHAGKTVVAVYELIDDDHYRIAFHPAGKTPPEAFATKEGSGHIVHAWKRVKKN